MFPFIFEWWATLEPTRYVFMIPFYTVLVSLFVIVNICLIGAVVKWACNSDDDGHAEHH